MGGGAIAGLVVGALVILIGSVFGGMVLLKKRRKRMMLSGRDSSYNNGSYPAKREVVGDSTQEPKSLGDKVSGLWAGMMAKKSKADEARSVPDPYSSYNTRHQSRLPVPFGSGNQASSPGQQQPQQQYQQYQQPPQLQNTAPRAQPVVSFPPPVTSNITPVSSSIFLPGDSSRPLLGQGLFKIVPDAEDVEEEKLNAAAARQGTNSATLQSVELNLGGDFLSSVINYENQEQRFESLENQANSGANSRNSNAPNSRDITVPPVDGPASEIQEYTLNTAYHDRSAGKQRQSTQRDQGEGDKQELDDDETPLAPSPVVIVGSDIVFEPLPSMKAAAAAAAAAVATGVSTDSNPSPPPPPESKSNVSDSSTVSSPSSPTSTLTRMATIGKILPTMGTEEYLERTDDKEEYSFGLHGDRRDMASSPSASSAPPIPPPPIARSTKPKPKTKPIGK
ncbi:hypothetical protein BGZ81_010689 [Podila clonocystis]|nr:hypothetical protein BGZ81_010689 [Podila clonocystis]